MTANPLETSIDAVQQANSSGRPKNAVGMHTGASAPLKELQRKFGFEQDQVVNAARRQLGRA